MKSTKCGFTNACFHSNQVYVHLILPFAKSDVPVGLHDYFQKESLRPLQIMDVLLKHPTWRGKKPYISD